MENYNGYKNYETWNVALWIGNDESLYELAKTCSNYKEFASIMTSEIGMNSTLDNVNFNNPNLSIGELDAVIKEL